MGFTFPYLAWLGLETAWKYVSFQCFSTLEIMEREQHTFVKMPLQLFEIALLNTNVHVQQLVLWCAFHLDPFPRRIVSLLDGVGTP
jgi:hypothetical protein